MTYAEIAEGVKRTIAAYTQALDDGRPEEVGATFCVDGSCDIPGLGSHAGHDALRQAYDRVAPRKPQRHLVLNTLLTDWNEQEVTAISDVVFLFRGAAGWSVQLVGRYTDTLHAADGSWLFHSRSAEFLN